ncbi:hypothetical protein JCM24511_06991 [Saitozyma sp. JCM 24511]|nr:hypothetical protein JCM24511_06991 [Saitozyma sp. JCM 24511]
MTGVKEVVDQAIKQNKVAVFGKSWCPYCQRAKAILAAVTKDSDLLYWDLDKREDGSDIQAYLKSLNGQGTVPHVYIQQEFIGGCSDLQAIPESKLKAKISA